MPRPARRNKSRRSGYTTLDIKFLADGPHGVPCAMTTAEMSGDEDAIKAAWESLRATIMRDWIRRKPGTRCWGWWRFDSPEKRRRIDGKVHPFDDPARSLAVARTDRPNAWKLAYALYLGMPSTHIPPHDADIHADFMQNTLHGRESELFEPEWSYLVRHNLLTTEDSP